MKFKVEFLGAFIVAIVLILGFAETAVLGQDSSTSVQEPTTAKSATKPKTSWKPRDIEGTWSNAAIVSFERPKEYGNQEFLTDAQYQAEENKLVERNKLPGRDSRESRDGKDIRGTEKDVARAFNQQWFGDKTNVLSRRTSMIIDPPDGRMPAYTPEAQARITAKREYLAALLQGTSGGKPGPISALRYQPSPDYNLDRINRLDGPEDGSNAERCFLANLPVMLQAGPLTPDGRPVGDFGGVIRIVDSRDLVDIYYDVPNGDGFNRTIPITNRPHLTKDVRQYWGDSIGRWEGDTLVVDVTNFTNQSNFRGSRETLHLIERYKRIDPKTLQITITAEDPTTWVKPFTFVEELSKNADKPNMVYEAPGCHEGNHGLIDMMISTRAAEKLFEEGKGLNPALEDNASGDAGITE